MLLLQGHPTKAPGARLLTIPLEGKLVHGFEGVDVGERIHVQLIAVDVEQGYIDFRKVGPSRHRLGDSCIHMQMHGRRNRVQGKSMPTITTPMPAAGSLPNGHREVLYWRVTEKPIRIVILQVLAFLCLAIFGLIFTNLAINLGKLPSNNRLGLGEISLIFIAILLTFVLHELTHGWVMQMFGAKPKYGILWKGPMLFVTSPGSAYRRNNYLVISLAPFVFITALVVLGMWILQGTPWVALLGI
jgi:hypothetical protein